MPPSQQSPSPSSFRRPSLPDRASSTHSLSSSGKQSKINRAYVVGQRFTRNTSYGKNLNKLPKINSSQAIAEGTARNHQRKGSGPEKTTPSTSPKVHFKRNKSHVSLNKNTSSTALRRNHSAASIVRNQSATQLKKHGLAPLTPARPQKNDPQKDTGFHFGNGETSSDEGEAEWEDTSHSPETTRQNSAYSTRPTSPVDTRSAKEQQRRTSPPPPSMRPTHFSSPTLVGQGSDFDHNQRPSDLLHYNPKSGVLPAMSSVSAMATKPQSNLPKAAEPKPTANGAVANGSPIGASTSTSAENGISKFIGTSAPSRGSSSYALEADDSLDLPSSFLPNYHPRLDSLAQPKSAHRQPSTPISSRTQQRLDLQRRETMRASTTPTTSNPAHDPSSSLQMPRPGSRNRSRASAINPVDPKAARQDYESSSRQLNVVRRFRNPITESLTRLEDSGALNTQTPGPTKGKPRPDPGPRPASRAGPIAAANGRAAINGSAGDPLNINGKLLSRSLEERRQEHDMQARPRVRFQRQGSHDDIGLSRSRGDTDDEEEVVGRGVVGGGRDEVELLRRIWAAKVWVGG